MLKCCFGQRPSFFPFLKRGEGGRGHLASVNVPTSLRLLSFVPTCAFQSSAPGSWERAHSSAYSAFPNAQCPAGTTSTAQRRGTEDQTLDRPERDRNCRKILSVTEKGKQKGQCKMKCTSVIGEEKGEKKVSENAHHLFASARTMLLP